MGFRFRKSVKIIPGVRLNFSKSGTSVSVGGKGFTTNYSKRGARSTVSLPGSGISYSVRHSKSAPTSASNAPNGRGGTGKLWKVVAVLLIAFVLLRWIF